MSEYKISSKIKKIRKDNNLTQKELADMLGVTYQAVSKWENDLNIPDIIILKDISKKFNIDLDELITGRVKRKRYLFITTILFLIIFSSSLLLILNNKNTYYFNNIKSNDKNFEVLGVIAYSNNKSSIYISEVKTNLKEDEKYKQIEVILYELNGDKHTQIKECGTEICSGETLDSLLKNITFNISSFLSTCKNFNESHLYLEINLVDMQDKTIKYEIPLIIEDEC